MSVWNLCYLGPSPRLYQPQRKFPEKRINVGDLIIDMMLKSNVEYSTPFSKVFSYAGTTLVILRNSLLPLLCR